MPIEECKVYDSKGKLKRKISSEECKELFWENIPVWDRTVIKTSKRKQLVKDRTQNWVCVECKETFKATVERSYCHTPCTDPNEDVVRVDMIMKPRICENYKCKKTFKPNRSRQIFCHDPCTRYTAYELKNKRT